MNNYSGNLQNPVLSNVRGSNTSEGAFYLEGCDMTPHFPSSESGPSLEQPLHSRLSLDDRRNTSSGIGFGTPCTQPYGSCLTLDDRKL